MNTKTTGRRVLLHGLSMILVGLVWGLGVPHTPFPRIALSAHIQLEVNGLLFVTLSLVVLKALPTLGRVSCIALHSAAWLAWPMLISAVGNAWWGTNQTLSIAALQAGATGGNAWQEAFVTATHVAGGLSLIVAVTLLLVGAWKGLNKESV
ncbi:MAG: hypothetical protein KJP25_00790 [Gammaproteobacteria bacterium]|nr:hypothetical protein [Gammaproteobacteria bacterium]